MHEQLIGGARQDFYDEWGMDEHMVGENMGIYGEGRHHGAHK